MGFQDYTMVDFAIWLLVFFIGIIVGRITMAIQVAYMKEQVKKKK